MANRATLVRGKSGKFQNAKSSAAIKRRLGKPGAKKTVSDARQRIIQKKRKTVVDARDILARMAKAQDARSKLLKMRDPSSAGRAGNVRPIGANILRKTDRNGKITLVTTNKNRASHDMNLKIQRQLGLVQSPRTMPARPKKVVAKRTRLEYDPLVIRKTIRNDYSPPPPLVSPYAYEHPDVYRWYPGVSPLIASLDFRRPIVGHEKVRPNGYIDLDAVVDDEDMPMASPVRPGLSRTPSNIHSRLDTKPTQGASHGILAQAKTKVVVPMGHRIVVSNLQATVTEDDIRELFEDIGQLLVARLVRPGTAEVIYKNLKDAQKAVDTYHNRQLDGQPMKCLLVNKRPINNPTAPAIKSTTDSIISTRKSSASQSSSNKLVPDLPTIHKVLFQRN